jgi:hypothetical protein
MSMKPNKSTKSRNPLLDRHSSMNETQPINLKLSNASLVDEKDSTTSISAKVELLPLKFSTGKVANKLTE